MGKCPKHNETVPMKRSGGSMIGLDIQVSLSLSRTSDTIFMLSITIMNEMKGSISSGLTVSQVKHDPLDPQNEGTGKKKEVSLI